MQPTISEVADNLPHLIEKLGLIGKAADEVGLTLHPDPRRELLWRIRKGVFETIAHAHLGMWDVGVEVRHVVQPCNVFVAYNKPRGWYTYSTGDIRNMRTLARRIKDLLPELTGPSRDEEGCRAVNALFSWFIQATKKMKEEMPPPEEF